jgi:hypothetical protein
MSVYDDIQTGEFGITVCFGVRLRHSRRSRTAPPLTFSLRKRAEPAWTT